MMRGNSSRGVRQSGTDHANINKCLSYLMYYDYHPKISKFQSFNWLIHDPM